MQNSLKASAALIGSALVSGCSIALTNPFGVPLSEVSTGPATERVVGYVAIAAGAVAMAILLIGFYKLVRLLGG